MIFELKFTRLSNKALGVGLPHEGKVGLKAFRQRERKSGRWGGIKINCQENYKARFQLNSPVL